MPLPKYKERRASVCAYLCISIAGRKVLKFRETIALQLDVFAQLNSLSRLSPKGPNIISYIVRNYNWQSDFSTF